MNLQITYCKSLITVNVIPVIGKERRKQEKTCVFHIKSLAVARPLDFMKSLMYLHQRVIEIFGMLFSSSA